MNLMLPCNYKNSQSEGSSEILCLAEKRTKYSRLKCSPTPLEGGLVSSNLPIWSLPIEAAFITPVCAAPHLLEGHERLLASSIFLFLRVLSIVKVSFKFQKHCRNPPAYLRLNKYLCALWNRGTLLTYVREDQCPGSEGLTLELRAPERLLNLQGGQVSNQPVHHHWPKELQEVQPDEQGEGCRKPGNGPWLLYKDPYIERISLVG